MKTQQLYLSLQKAAHKLTEAQDFPDTEPMREATIQRFEYTFELSWKLMSSILKDQSIAVYGVKNIIREAAKIGLIQDVNKWFEFSLARNKAAHIYKELIATEVYQVATGDFLSYVRQLLTAAAKQA